MMNYFSNNFTIEESKASIEKEMICLDQYYHQHEASMTSAAFIIILLVCSLLTGLVVFAVLNFLWKKFRSRRFQESRPGPRTVRDEEVYVAGQKTWTHTKEPKSLRLVEKSHWRSKVMARSNSIVPTDDDENRLGAKTTNCTWTL